MVNLNIFGARARHIRIMGIVRLGYHGSTETIREAAKNNEESISERLVQAIEDERENTRPPENKKQGKETKNKKNKFDTPQKEKGEKSNTEKRRRKTAQPQKKQKKARKKKEANNSNRKRIRRSLLIYVCHSLIYE